MGCTPQLAHRSILLGEKHQEERIFFQTRADRSFSKGCGQECSGCAKGESFCSGEEKLPALPSGPFGRWQVQDPVIMELFLLQYRAFGDKLSY